MSRVPRSIPVIAGVVSIFAVAPIALSQGFQGVVTYKTYKDGGGSDTMVETTKGNKARFETGGGRMGAFIIDNDAQTWTMIDDRAKTFTHITAQQAKEFREVSSAYAAAATRQMGGAKEPKSETGPKIVVVKTGRTETVAGVSCDVYAGAGQDSQGKVKKGEVCIAKGVGFNPATFMSGPLAMMGGGRGAGGLPPGMEGLADALKGGGGILKMTEIKDNGQPQVEFEATQIQPGTVSDATFQPPSGYSEQKMPDMKQLMSAPGLQH